MRIKQEKLYYYLVIILFLFAIFSPTITVIGLSIPFYWFIALMGWAVIPYKRWINQNIISFGALVLFILGYFIIIMLIAGQTDNRILMFLFSSIGYVSFIFYIIGPTINNDEKATSLYNAYVTATFIHSFIVLFFFIYPEIRLSMHPFLFASDFVISALSSQWRGLGISSQSGETEAISHGIALFFVTRLLLLKKKSLIKSLIITIVIIASLVLLNRIGLVIGLIGIVSALIFPGIKLSRRLVGVKFFLLIAILIALSVSFFLKDMTPAAIKRTMEIYSSLDDQGRVTTGSTEVIFERMLFLPDVPLLYGTGNFGRQDMLEYVPSDVGYVRLFNGSGVIGIVLWVLIPLYFLLNFKENSETKSLGLFLALVWVLANIKVLWIFPPDGPSVAAGILIYMRYTNQTKKNKIEY